MTKILVVDDDLALSDVLAFAIRRAGFEVVNAHDGLSALEVFNKEMPDLIVLDWGLPRMDGLEVCTRIRNESEVPIIMLTVRDTDDNVITALEAGADEYIIKPFSPRQLIARIRALLRRVVSEPQEVLQAGELSFDAERREVRVGDSEPVHLTHLETRLLRALMQNPDRVLNNDTLILRVWGPEGATNEMLKQLVYRLRNKLDTSPGASSLIETIPNAGYVLNTRSSPV
ncbi:MAG: DNA-binding response regulator [Anaerolineales bacterium]|nr:MAG: DNA-binding response regulator [Anaerolineales bacterium]